jgi:hypothetical protein
MSFSLVWLYDVLKDAGLRVAPYDEGWKTRGNRSRDVGEIKGVICHHTGTDAPGNMPTLKTLVHGRNDLSGPLAQLGLGRDGTYYLIAAGRCNHAGEGSWRGITTGNANFIGIEAENRGTEEDHWPEVQMDAYRRGVAAILSYLHLEPIMCCGHKEYAPKRKPDPLFDMVAFRKGVEDIMNAVAPKLEPIPAHEPPDAAGKGGRPTLKRGSAGEWVEKLQEALDMVADGQFGPRTEAKLRDFQRSQGLVPDGIAGPRTWSALDEPAHPIQLSGALSSSATASAAGAGQTDDTDAWLGQLSAKYETGNRGPGTVSTGAGDAGGVSYGSYQMTSKPKGGTVKQFIEQDGFKWKDKFNGLNPGTSAFKACWQNIARDEGQAFQAAQHEFIKRTHFDPLVGNLSRRNGLDLTTRSHALQNVAWSTAVQHGPHNTIVSIALDRLKASGQDGPGGDKFDEHLIRAIYTERGRRKPDGRMVYFSRNTLDVQRSVANRFVSELADALKMLEG